MAIEPFSLRLRKGPRPAARQSLLESLESRIALSVSDVSPLLQADDVLDINAAGVASPQAETSEVPDAEAAAMADAAMAGMDMPGMEMPGGVTVTPTSIITMTDVIPRFAANPTNTTVRSGNWTDPNIWSAGRVPVNGDRISIAEGHTVVYNALSNTRLDTVEVSGSLIFSTNTNTRMLVANILVMPTGTLQIGSPTAPVQAGVTAEVIIANKPLDLAKDPRQFGTGMIVLGTITIHGASIDQTWQRLSVEPMAGSRMLWLDDAAVDWKAGDTLVVPDSRQPDASAYRAFDSGQLPPEWEEVVIDRVVGRIVFLTTPLKYDHPGARNVDGQVELMPHVALLNRNVTIRSENPAGTRGHTLYTARANVDIEFAKFLDLGRTDAFKNISNSVFDSNGQLIYYGTNQIGRYAIHLHHVLGPENPTNTGYQFKLIGNTVQGSKKWGIAVHGTSFGLVDRNVVYGAQGAGIVTEDGSEIGNIFSNNITIRIQGTHSDGKEGTLEGDYGRGGSGFWFRRGGNVITGNVAVDSTYAGFVLDGYNMPAVRLPMFRGADMHDPMQTVDGSLTPGTTFTGNEAYGMSSYGLWAAFVNGEVSLANQPTTLITDFRVWGILHAGVWAYHTANLTFDRMTILGSLDARDRNDWGPTGMDLKLYENLNLVVQNSRIEGMYWGILAPTVDASTPGVERPTIIRNTDLKNYINIVVSPVRDSVGTGNSLEVRDVRFRLVTDLPSGPYPSSTIQPAANIQMKVTGDQIDYTRPSIVRVYNYNGVTGDNFQVFYREQAASYVLPKTDTSRLATREWGVVGSPVAGLTNAQNWATYGIAMAGAVAPSNAVNVRKEINGLTAAIQPISSVPRIVMVTPWSNAVINASYVRLRYNVIGQLPAGAKVYFQLDNQTPVTDVSGGGFFNLKAGYHTLEAYFTDANGRRLIGYASTLSRFWTTG